MDGREAVSDIAVGEGARLRCRAEKVLTVSYLGQQEQPIVTHAKVAAQPDFCVVSLEVGDDDLINGLRV